jgi:hypothetical protein
MRPTQRRMSNTSHVPKKNALSLLNLKMKSSPMNPHENTMPIPANEKPEWLLRSSARKVLFQPRNRIFSPRVSKPSSQARKLSPKQFSQNE